MEELSANDREVLEKRIRHYVSSTVLGAENGQWDNFFDRMQGTYQSVYQKIPNGQPLDKNEDTRQEHKDRESFEKAKAMEEENEAYREALLRCRTKEEAVRLKQQYMDSAIYGLSLIESSLSIPEDRRQAYALYKDTRLAAIENITQAFMESDTYRALPTDAEYREKLEALSAVTGSREAQESEAWKRDRGKTVYENLRQSMGAEETVLIDIRG